MTEVASGHPGQRLGLAFQEIDQWCSDGAIVVNEASVGI